MANKKIIEKYGFNIVIAIFIITAIGLFPPFASYTNAAYYDNTTVLTLLNISNAAPILTDVIVFDNNSIVSGNIQLNEGTTQKIYCNGTANDTNGWNTTINTNATLFLNGYYTTANDRNNRYFNNSCQVTQNNGFANSATIQCAFDVYFFANNGTWNCSMTVEDDGYMTDQEYARTGKYLAPFYAIELNTTVIDYGVLNVTAISQEQSVLIKNTGNMNINISVEGYGEVLNDSKSMICSYNTSIPIGYEKYSVVSGLNYTFNMTNLTSSPMRNGIANLTIPQNTVDLSNSTRPMYWKISPPLGIETGPCNGTVIFSAVSI